MSTIQATVFVQSLPITSQGQRSRSALAHKHLTRSGVNQMWILKNSKELLDHLKSPNFNLITNIKSFDHSTLYTTIPHQKLKSRLATINETPSFTKMEIGDTNIWF